MPRLPFRATKVPGIEVVGIRGLADRMDVGADGRPHRVEFHVVTIVSSGSGRREVDFRSVALGSDTLLWVRPGQVQRFDDGDLDGVHLLVTDAFLTSLPAADTIGVRGPVHVLDAATAASVRTVAAELAREYEQPAPSKMVLQLLLRTIAALLERSVGGSSTGAEDDPVVERFRAAVEDSFTQLRTVAEYARVLGYSTRTVSRAVQAATGRSPKQVIDRRIALEAQRLLGYTDLPVARIAERLGFSEPTNFSRFFQRTTGVPATRFRDEHRNGPAS